MKKETKKNLISLTCALAFVAVGGGVALTQNHAKAEEILLIENNEMVLEEPEFRLKKAEEDENRNGLRFVVKAPNATELPEGTTETGTLVIPTELLNGELTVNTPDVHKFETKEAWNIYDDGAYTYAYFWNMSEFSYNVEMTYRAYIVKDGETYYTKTATTSLAEVALDFINKSTDDGEKAVADQFLLNYDVTFDVGDSSTTVNAQQVKYGSKLAEVVTPQLEGHTFNGWLLNGEAFDVENTAIKGDIELVADWELNTYAVTFKDVDGDTTRFETLEVDWNTTATAPEFIALEPYKADALVWNTEDGEAFDFDTPITENTTLVAKRTLSDLIDFTTMTRQPSELLGGTNVKWAMDFDNHVLTASNIWKKNENNARFYFADGIQLKKGDVIAVELQLVTAVDIGHLCVNEVAETWNDTTQWAKNTDTQTLYYNLKEDTFVEYIRFRTNHGSLAESLNLKKIEVRRTLDVPDYKNINIAELGGKPNNMSVVTTRGVQYSYYSHLEQAVICETYSNTSGPARIGALFTFPTEGDDVITVVAGMKISLVVKVELTNGALTADMKGGFYFNNGQWGANDNVVTVKADGTSTGYQTVSFTIAAGNAQIGSTLTEFNWKPWHTGNNVHTIYVKSVTIELPQA